MHKRNKASSFSTVKNETNVGKTGLTKAHRNITKLQSDSPYCFAILRRYLYVSVVKKVKTDAAFVGLIFDKIPLRLNHIECFIQPP